MTEQAWSIKDLLYGKKKTILSDDSARSVKSLQKQLPPIVLILVQSVVRLFTFFFHGRVLSIRLFYADGHYGGWADSVHPRMTLSRHVFNLNQSKSEKISANYIQL